MDTGDMPRKLSVWAEQDKNHRFFDLYHLLYDRDWLRLAHDHVAQHAGSGTAGCDGITMPLFEGSPHETDFTVRSRKSHRARQAFAVIGSVSLSG